MPGAVAVPTSSPDWIIDYINPRPANDAFVGGLPTAASGTFPSATDQFNTQTWPFGLAASDVQYQVGSSASAGSGVVATCRGGRWLARIGRSLEAGAGSGSCGVGWRTPGWLPALDPNTSRDDEEQRIFWLRLWMLEGGADTLPGVANSLGFCLLPDDGANFSSSTWPPPNAAGRGGFGIFKRTVAGGLFNYASFGPAGALLESQNLASYGAQGWHTADIIIRQAKRGDATTPWLTLRWDGLDVITRRPFGSALLLAPTNLANAHGWAIWMGSNASTTGQLSLYWRLRVGRFHPDGFLEPA